MNQKQIIGLIIILFLLYLSHVKIIEVTNKQLLLIFIINVAILFLMSNTIFEELTATSNEAVQNLGSVYNSANATLTNLQVTGTLKVGNSILMNGDPNSTNKIEIYQNSDGLDPKMTFDKNGKLNLSSNSSVGSFISNNGSSLSGNLNASGDVVVKNNLILDGTNKWIFNTPDDGRKTLNIAPYGQTDWNWELVTTLDGTTGNFRLPNKAPKTIGAYIGDGRDAQMPLVVGNGRLSTDGSFCDNCEDYVVLLPGYGIKLWNTATAPNYTTAGDWKAENNTNSIAYYSLWGSNKMDFYSVYAL